MNRIYMGMLWLLPVVAIAGEQPREPVAEEPALPCFAHPSPKCSYFILTNAGGYVKLGSSNRFMALWDLGFLVNVGAYDAVGGSWFLTYEYDDNEVFSTGAVVRYRRWFTKNRSLDVGIGPLLGRLDEKVKVGSLVGFVKYNPVHWFGVAIRPEYVRQTEDLYYDPITGFGYWGKKHTVTYRHVYAGVEVGSVPGLSLALVSLGVGGLFVLLISIAMSGP
jgi:hypothetical protein